MTHNKEHVIIHKAKAAVAWVRENPKKSGAIALAVVVLALVF